ncbi:MAG: peptidoglycan editing factor PgeF [Pseudomonadota bacterium]|nr:MAG: peptidoglycan editing factor PgeF [Pseudomonadota bacterium]
MSAALHPDWIVPDWPAPPSVKAFITTRAGGVSAGPYASFNPSPRVGDDPAAVERNLEILRSVLPADPVWLRQVHGTQVVDAASAAPYTEADGSVAHVRHIVCGVWTADCMPVLFADREGHAVGVAHAGWRGLAAGVLEATLARLGVAPERVMAYLGPAISQRAFEVGNDVYEAFVNDDPEAADAFLPGAAGKYHADLYALARLRLARAGVKEVYGGGFCTYTQAERFYSFRRDRVTGRMASLIWLD